MDALKALNLISLLQIYFLFKIESINFEQVNYKIHVYTILEVALPN